MTTQEQLKALQQAAESGDLAAVRRLVESEGVSLNARALSCAVSPLSAAEDKGHWEVVEYLLFRETETGYALKTTLDSAQATMLLVASAYFGEDPEYKPSEGLCHGETGAFVDAFLLQDDEDEKADSPVDIFYERISLIDRLVLEAKRRAFTMALNVCAPSHDNLIQKYKELTEQGLRQELARPLSEYIDIRSFFETMEVRQQFGRYRGILYETEENPSREQNDIVSAQLFGSAALEERGGLFEVVNLTGLYTRDDLIRFFDGFQKDIAQRGSPVCLKLRADVDDSGHIIAIGYDARRKQWIFNDINRFLPPNYGGSQPVGPYCISANDTAKLADCVAYSLIMDHELREDFLAGIGSHIFGVRGYAKAMPCSAVQKDYVNCQKKYAENLEKLNKIDLCIKELRSGQFSPRKQNEVAAEISSGWDQARADMRRFVSCKTDIDDKIKQHRLPMIESMHQLTVRSAYKHRKHPHKERLIDQLLSEALVLTGSGLATLAALIFGAAFPAVVAAVATVAAGVALLAVCGIVYSAVTYYRQSTQSVQEITALHEARVEKYQNKNQTSAAEILKALDVPVGGHPKEDEDMVMIPVEKAFPDIDMPLTVSIKPDVSDKVPVFSRASTRTF